MSKYETHIRSVEKSIVTIGDNAKVEGNTGRSDAAEALGVLIGIVSKYADPVADEVLGLALDARREIKVEKPEKRVFQRLTEATRKMMEKLGPSLVEAGTLADAVAKISNVIHHP